MNLTTYTATQGERLDTIFFKLYGNTFNQKAYDDFLMQNYKLLNKDLLDGGDAVIIDLNAIEQSNNQTNNNEDVEGLYGIQL
ncbi:hypothetical protein BKH41_03730 [Helicobacter sp. 12S02232-10]|uniref:hypothetical protein n=1 Tax=Helicobacter sp. 12S02232-10 TaxID=1476197 RepID=UPI000BA5F58F|nr:hypothetical protein [Helicobacter sp. 12S02232-10]PAF49202.1 hypothetical protein BKH41_03730 [Helicobacter sp. 12S02232-10]